MLCMVDQHEALAVTTDLLIYLVRPTGIRTVNPWSSKQQPCILPLSYIYLQQTYFSIFYQIQVLVYTPGKAGLQQSTPKVVIATIIHLSPRSSASRGQPESLLHVSLTPFQQIAWYPQYPQ
jgi:hypothetical protein